MQGGLTLTADHISYANFILKPGKLTTTVEVQASGTQIDTTGGSISQVIDAKTIAELPLNGRNPASLVALAPGGIDANQSQGKISTPGVGNGSPNETAASVNGSRSGGTEYLLDGIVNMNNYFRSANPFPNPEATQEFRVISNNFDAQYGYTTGGIVSVVTRGGTNEWHGNGFEFLRNNVLNAKDYFTKEADPLKRNQFGGSIGGPIIHNKLFIFGNTQFTRERISSSSSGYVVPNNRELAGDFSQICGSGFTNGICNDRDSSGNIINQVYKNWYDHSVGNAYLNNYIDPSSFSNFAKLFALGLPKTDDPEGLVSQYGVAQINNVYEYTTRVDYNINARQVLSGRTFYTNYNRAPYNGPPNYIVGGTRSALDQVLNVSISHIWSIRPNLVNDLRGGYSKNNSQADPNMNAVGGGPLSFKALGSNLATESSWLGGVFISSFGLSAIPVTGARHNWVVDDTLSLTKGKQALLVGGGFYTVYGLETSTWEGDPLVSFDGSVTGDAKADFMLGLVDNVLASGGEYNVYASKNYSAFAQDTIKLTPRLTIDLGLRWEPQIAPVSVGLHTADFFPGQKSMRFPNAPAGLVFPGDHGVAAGGWNDRWGTLLPRISVAWAPRPTTTLRAAYGLMALPYDLSSYNHQSANAPFSPEYNLWYNTVGNCTLTITNPFGCNPSTNYTDPFPPFAGPKFNPSSNATFALPTTLQSVFTRGYSPAMENSWNVSIEHSFRNNYLFTVAYIGHRDYNNPMPLELSPGVYNGCITISSTCTQAQVSANGARLYAPNFGSILSYKSIGVGSYNSIQISAQKQFSHGFQFTSNYTFSKNLDDTSMSSEANVGSVPDPFNPSFNYGISDLNIPQIFNNTFVYQTPTLASLGRLGSALLGGFEIAGDVAMHSGFPVQILGGSNPIAVGGGNDNASYSGVYSDYADKVPGQTLWTHKGSKAQWLQEYFNTAAVTYNAPGTFGNIGRNPIYGPGYNNTDLMFAKNLRFEKRYEFQLRWEMFNALNRTEFSTPSNNYNPSANSGFGQITSTALPARAMQAGVKLSF